MSKEHRPNLHFEFARLPEVPPRRFDLVTCNATLHYLDSPMAAVQNLYTLVNPGGYLIFNYPNRHTRAWYARWTRDDTSLQARFALLLAGENLLTQRGIRTVLGQRPTSFWAAVGEPGSRENPCVTVVKR